MLMQGKKAPRRREAALSLTLIPQPNTRESMNKAQAVLRAVAAAREIKEAHCAGGFGVNMLVVALRR
jgi:hypothetical protein